MKTDRLTQLRMAHWARCIRAKYTQAEIDALGVKGQAFKDGDGAYTYPIVDRDDLGNAIKAVGRSNADHDAIRQYVNARAADLGESDEIPDNWAASGALTDDRTANLDAEQRQSYNDLYDALGSAIADKFRSSGDGDDDYDDWTWIVDFDTDGTCIFSQNGQKFQINYVLAGDTLTLGDKTPVRTETTYVPIDVEEGTAINVLGRSADTALSMNQIREALGLPTVAAGESEQARAAKNWATPKRKSARYLERAPALHTEVTIRMSDLLGGAAGSVESTSQSGAVLIPDGTALFRGYAYTSGDSYEVRDWLGEYTETIQPGASAKTLRETENIPLLYNHDGLPLAATRSGTSRLAEDGHGLLNEASFDTTNMFTYAVCSGLRRGDLNSMSFSFRAVKDAWNDAYDDRSVSELAMYDTSVVDYPANPYTSAELVEEMRSALGREGMGYFLSLRSDSLPLIVARRASGEQLTSEVDDVLERAFRALVEADERMAGRYNHEGRARTLLVGRILADVRSGKSISNANEALLSQALSHLAQAGNSLATVNAGIDSAHRAISGTLETANETSEPEPGDDSTGKDADNGANSNQGVGQGNPLFPADGAGPRAAGEPEDVSKVVATPSVAVLAARREVQRLKNSSARLGR